MKGIMKLLAWFLFILCTHALSGLALTSFFNLDHEGANSARPIVQEQEIRGADDAVKTYGEKHEMDESRKNQRGKGGVYGGANVNHDRPRPTVKSSATSILLGRPQQLQPYPITKTMFQVSFALILILPFQLL